MPNVKLTDIRKTFEKGRIVAVDHVDLLVRDREYLTLLGPSGCGKTTTLRMVAGLIEPDKGEIHIDNQLVSDHPPEDRDVGYVFQQYALFPHMDVWDNVTYGPRVKGLDEEKSERICREMLEMVKLSERTDALPRELSGGMQQRIALARALAAGAKLLLLDEPLGALDAKIRTELRYELRKLVKDLKLTAIHVTHDQGEAMAISDRIAVMKKGRILQVGTPQELYMKPKHLFVAHFIGESNFLEGFVSKTNGKESIIELREGLMVHTLDKTYRKADKVVIAVRPEIFVIEKGRKKGVNSLYGNVEKYRFEGTNTRCEIQLENGDTVVVVRPALLTERLDAGEEVTVSFPVGKHFVFPYPEKGLREELRVE
ncbi:MAG: ABC transporter ATP-binding protein [Candidatus Bathyarchaeota archaeon]|nr:MAG: ABC transporter ATP-binding protein [Candidatus Bathyarchaeota archaeon]